MPRQLGCKVLSCTVFCSPSFRTSVNWDRWWILRHTSLANVKTIIYCQILYCIKLWKLVNYVLNFLFPFCAVRLLVPAYQKVFFWHPFPPYFQSVTIQGIKAIFFSYLLFMDAKRSSLENYLNYFRKMATETSFFSLIHRTIGMMMMKRGRQK